MLAAAPTTPPCFRRWRRSSSLHSGHVQRKNYFIFRVWSDRVCAAMKAPVGLLSGRAVCVSRWRGFAPTSSAERSKRIFTGGVVKANDSCNSTVNFSAMPRALPLGELARQRLRGRARCGEGAPLPSAPAGRSHLPQGDGFSGDGKLPGIAQRRPLEG